MRLPSFVERARTAAIGLAVAAICGPTLLAQAPLPAAPRDGSAAVAQPPVLDRELFFGNPEITGAQISPDGRYIAFIKPYKDTRNVWVKKAAEPFGAARLITADTKRPIPRYFWSRDSKYILYVQDNAGDENYNVYAVNPAEMPAAGQDAPAARNLTDAKGARAMIYSVPKRTPDVIYVGLNDRDAAWHDVYRVSLASGERTLLRKNADRIAGWVFDQQGELRLGVRTTDAGDTEILAVSGDTLKPVYTCTVLESCGPVRFHKDNARVYLQSNKGDANDFVRLVLLDPARAPA